ncbi:hypothetical protein RF11_04819 [Thelohanellus kitauei]|uniref:Uncharacterized protein n=1 Tax=Thelohanellus kitauei TaxID=669202 RepID=A0A0C2J652_THEKT|nr:hypothetical protein RF11_04819 [Thelohanellus kitauei]
MYFIELMILCLEECQVTSVAEIRNRLFILIESGSDISPSDCDSYHRNMLKYNKGCKVIIKASFSLPLNDNQYSFNNLRTAQSSEDKTTEFVGSKCYEYLRFKNAEHKISCYIFHHLNCEALKFNRIICDIISESGSTSKPLIIIKDRLVDYDLNMVLTNDNKDNQISIEDPKYSFVITLIGELLKTKANSQFKNERSNYICEASFDDIANQFKRLLINRIIYMSLIIIAVVIVATVGVVTLVRLSKGKT